MNKEIAKALNDLNIRINEVQLSLDTLTNKLHNESLELIEENSDAVLEVYETSLETSDTVSELEDAVLEVYELLVEEESGE